MAEVALDRLRMGSLCDEERSARVTEGVYPHLGDSDLPEDGSLVETWAPPWADDPLDPIWDIDC